MDADHDDIEDEKQEISTKGKSRLRIQVERSNVQLDELLKKAMEKKAKVEETLAGNVEKIALLKDEFNVLKRQQGVMTKNQRAQITELEVGLASIQKD